MILAGYSNAELHPTSNLIFDWQPADSPAAAWQRMARREVVEASVLRVAAAGSLGRVAHRAAVGLKRVVTYGPCILV